MSTATLGYLLAIAIQLTGYLPPDKLPTVVGHDTGFFLATVCGGRPCSARAYTIGRTIHIDDTLSPADIRTQGLVLHELVHVLQGYNSDRHHDCAEYIHNEREAYLVQAVFLAEHGLNMKVGNILHQYHCYKEVSNE